ncbi:hypothetical protein MRB53_013353 [Persea americana]|uniref:Uncharacterized protein n=1 Tax=Persea americana TaxID=3435 RepID=A0ACC2K858_PERAE|nr:hypothetical protein MRB53_013353 [Persea americana]
MENLVGAFRLEKPSVAYKTLKTGIPLKNGLHEFLHVEKSPRGNHSTVTGFSVIVFDDVMKMLPYHVPEMDCESESSIIYKLLKDGFAATLPHPNCSGTSNLEGFKDFTNVSLHHGRSKALVENDMTGVKLRILVPSKNTFHEFVKVDYEPNENEMIATGYSVDVFKEVMDSLPYRVSYEFFPYENGHSSYMVYYDEVIQQLQLNGILVWIFEHEINPEFKGTFSEQVGKVLSFSFSISVFAQKEKLKSNYSRLVVNLWMFAVFVMVTTYASILQSMLTSDNDQPVFTRMEELIMNGDYVGYQKGSFVFDLLKHMGFQEQQLKAYSSVEEYAIALSRGSVNNGVSAIIDEIPYIKVFLAKYADRYMMAGPTFGPGGFGFLFKRDCAIVPNVSRAILEFLEGEKMPELEKKWFGFDEPNHFLPQIPQRNWRLSTKGLLGVLLITEPISVVALLVFIISIMFKYWKSPRNSSSNRAVEEGDTEESSNIVNIEINGSHINEDSNDGEGESDQATLNDSALEVEAALNDHSHSDVAFQNISLTGDEMENMLHSHTSTPTEEIGSTPALSHSNTRDVMSY